MYVEVPVPSWSGGVYHTLIIEWTRSQPSFDIKSTADEISITPYSGCYVILIDRYPIPRSPVSLLLIIKDVKGAIFPSFFFVFLFNLKNQESYKGTKQGWFSTEKCHPNTRKY